MNDKLNELKAKQEEISNKITSLQVTNKKKDEETVEIRKLIAECRENLNRIKGLGPGSEVLLEPCSEMEGLNIDPKEGDDKKNEAGIHTSEPINKRPNPVNDVKPLNDVNTVNPVLVPIDKKRCADLLGKKECKAPDTKKKGKCKDKISCRVDINKMKLRVRGPSEDLKKLDAAQLINLLEKYQCQELILNTGEEIIKDPGEIRLVYFLHPGNIVMAAGIIMIAFLVNANLCTTKRSYRTKLMLNTLYLSSFALHYGMVLWMSFIRGYALKFGLCQDTFHLVDNLILPKYFSVCVLLSALSLYSFLATHCAAPCTSWSLEVVAQMIVVVVTFFLELITICYIVPALIKLRDATDDYMLDDEEPECSVPDSYQKNLIKLGKLNWTICLTNFLTLVFLGANVYYITSKLNIGNN